MEVDYDDVSVNPRACLKERKNSIPKNWGKIGEIYSSPESQCSFICTICCVGHTGNFENTFITSDVSEFWNHMQQAHIATGSPLFAKETPEEVKNEEQELYVSPSVDNRQNAESTELRSDNMESSYIPSVGRSLEENLEYNQQTSHVISYKNEPEIDIHDVNLSDTESGTRNADTLRCHDVQRDQLSEGTYSQRTEPRETNNDGELDCSDVNTVQISNEASLQHTESHENGNALNCWDGQTVQISDDEDEDIPEGYDNNQPVIENMDTIELSDDEENGDYLNRIGSNTPQSVTSRSNYAYNYDNCWQKFPSRDDMIEHMKTHQTSETLINDATNGSNCIPTPEASPINSTDPDNELVQNYQCKFCQCSFCTILQLEEHQITHLSMGDIQRRKSKDCIQCSTCRKRFCSENRLKIHERLAHSSVTESESTNCLICLKIVLTTDLVLHMSTEHNQSGHPILTNLLLSGPGNHHSENVPSSQQPQVKSRPFKCVLCGKRTGSMETMVVHHRRFHSFETDPETSRCGICQKLILTKNMRTHISSVHSRLSRFGCKTCSISFRSKGSFQAHMYQVHFEHDPSTNQRLDDTPSSSSSASPIELTPEERAYLFQLFTEHSNGQSEIDDGTPPDSLNDDDDYDDDITYGEIIPPTPDS